MAVPVPAPTVVTTKNVTLADHLDLHNLPLATTPGGRNFALKCLHPAESTIKASRAPGSRVPTLGVACDLVETIPFPEYATSALIQQWPQLTHPMSIQFFNADGMRIRRYVFKNTALSAGASVLVQPETMTQLMTGFENLDKDIDGYRITAQSITCELVAPAVANQGTITSAQYSNRPATRQASVYEAGQFWNSVDVWLYNVAPSESQMMMGTSAYTGKAIEGFYQPLKLSKFKFVNANDTFIPMDDASDETVMYSAVKVLGENAIAFGAIPYEYSDHPFLKPSDYVSGITYIAGTAAGGATPGISLRIRFRQVAEIIPRLGGAYAPLSEAPLPPDELAFKMVCEIAGRMKDAYPSSYNDKGALMDTILKIGKSVLKYADPVLDIVGLIPGAGNVVNGARMATRMLKGVQVLASDRAKLSKAERAQTRARAQATGAALDRVLDQRLANLRAQYVPPPLPPRSKGKGRRGKKMKMD